MSDQENDEKKYHPQVIPPPEDFDFDGETDNEEEEEEEYYTPCYDCGEEILDEDIQVILRLGRGVCIECFKDYPESKE